MTRCSRELPLRSVHMVRLVSIEFGVNGSARDEPGELVRVTEMQDVFNHEVEHLVCYSHPERSQLPPDVADGSQNLLEFYALSAEQSEEPHFLPA